MFRSDIDIVLVPWEPCLTHVLEGKDVDRLFAGLPESTLREFSLALVAHARRNEIKRGRSDAFRFVDPLAAAVVVEPGIVTRSLRASIDVALAPGIARGMTIVDPSGRLGTPMVTIVEEVRTDRLAALYAASIGHAD